MLHGSGVLQVPTTIIKSGQLGPLGIGFWGGALRNKCTLNRKAQRVLSTCKVEPRVSLEV